MARVMEEAYGKFGSLFRSGKDSEVVFIPGICRLIDEQEVDRRSSPIKYSDMLIFTQRRV